MSLHLLKKVELSTGTTYWAVVISRTPLKLNDHIVYPRGIHEKSWNGDTNDVWNAIKQEWNTSKCLENMVCLEWNPSCNLNTLILFLFFNLQFKNVFFSRKHFFNKRIPRTNQASFNVIICFKKFHDEWRHSKRTECLELFKARL